MASLLSTLLLLGAAASPAQAAIAAWWNGIGPQILIQNSTTGQIRYSACNRKDEPRYSYTDGSVLSLPHKPKVGTPLAGVGWYNEKFTTASIFYVEEGGDIANGLFECNMSTGFFQSKGNWVITGNRVAPSIHSNTGLAAVVLGESAGYRVYYHDTDGAVNELGYTNDDDWNYRGIISNDINSLPALAATFTQKENITVVSPRDNSNIAVTRYNKDETWHRTTFPQPLKGDFTNSTTNRSDITINQTAEPSFTLPAWNGTTTGLGISLDSDSARNLWYIGNDKRLYSVTSDEKAGTWALVGNESSAFWPLADESNAALAVAYETRGSKVRIYYMVNGQLSEIKHEGTWRAWSTIPPPEPPVVAQSPTTTPSSETAQGGSESGLSTGAKAGIGVGVSLGAIALGAIIAVIVLMRRRKNQTFEQQPFVPDEGSTTLSPGTPAPSYGSPALARASAAQYENLGWDQKEIPASAPAVHPVATPGQHQQEVHQLDSISRPTELYAPQPMYELPSQSYSHELVAEPPRTFMQQQQEHQIPKQ